MWPRRRRLWLTDLQDQRRRCATHKVGAYTQVLVEDGYGRTRYDLILVGRALRREHRARNRDRKLDSDLPIRRPLSGLKPDETRSSRRAGRFRVWRRGAGPDRLVGVPEFGVVRWGVEGDLERLDADLVPETLPCHFGISGAEQVSALQNQCAGEITRWAAREFNAVGKLDGKRRTSHLLNCTRAWLCVGSLEKAGRADLRM
jgi:hypothetical protein